LQIYVWWCGGGASDVLVAGGGGGGFLPCQCSFQIICSLLYILCMLMLPSAEDTISRVVCCSSLHAWSE
jgi:hypothetical protein